MMAIGGRSRRERQRSEERERERGRERRRVRENGCLWWALVVIAAVFLLAILFGGFHKGALHGNDGSLGRPVTVSAPGAAVGLSLI